MNLPFVMGLLLMNLFAHFLPIWTRPELYFGVSVDPEFRKTDPGLRILGRYRAILWAFCASAIAFQFAIGFTEALLVQIAGYVFAMVGAHRRTLDFATAPSGIREVDLAAPAERLPGGLLLALVPAASLMALARWASLHWEQLPARLPIHWGLQGVDRWVQRSTVGVYGFIAVHAAFSLSLVLTAWGILHWSRRASANDPGELRFRNLSLQLALGISWLSVAQAWIALMRPDATGLWVGLMLTMIGVFGVLLIRSSQRHPATTTGDHTLDTCWKLGIFYVNPTDSAVFVRHRFGIGYTLNFGNLWSWVVLGAFLALAMTRSRLS